MTDTLPLGERVATNPWGVSGNWGARPCRSRWVRSVCIENSGTDWKAVDCADAVIPADCQHENSCCAYASATLIEAAYRLRDGAGAIPEGRQLSALRLYRAANDYFYGEADRDEGLEIDQALLTAIRERLLPPDTRLVEVAFDPASFASELRQGPLLLGTAVGTRFLYDTSPATGEIPFDDGADGWLGGHAHVCIGIQRDQDGRIWLRGQNSWSKWGLRGQYSMQWDTFKALQQPFAGRPLALRMGNMWSGWRLPQDWLVEHDAT